MMLILMFLIFSCSLSASEDGNTSEHSEQAQKTRLMLVSPNDPDRERKLKLYEYSHQLHSAIEDTLYALQRMRILTDNVLAAMYWTVKMYELPTALRNTLKQSVDLMHLLEETQLVPLNHPFLAKQLPEHIDRLNPNLPVLKTKHDPLYTDIVYKFNPQESALKPFYLQELTDVGEYKELMQKVLKQAQT